MKSKSTIVSLSVLLIACFTLVSAFSFGFYLHPYEHNPPNYEISHESAQEFEETVADANIDTDDAVQTTELPPDTRQAFQELTGQLPNGTQDQAGWQSADIEICQDSMLVCDEFTDPPDFPSHATTDFTIYTVVEQDGELYLVATEPSPNRPIIWTVLVIAPAIVIFSALLILVGIKYRSAPTAGVYSMATLGLLIGLWPYIVMSAGIERYWLAIFLLTSIGIVILIRQIQNLFQHN